jgi:tRNA1Val (adenine37-N6)-methyltransferase
MGDCFNFKKFSLRQDRCAMKVGTDGVLLGAWAVGGQRILDIGSGTGLIALMMAQRFPEATVDGVEMDEEAVAQSRENVAASPMAGRVVIHGARLQEYEPVAPYDAMVTNPPFFVNALKAPEAQRNMARHAVELTANDIFDFAARWLTEEGQLSAVIPMDCLDDYEMTAALHGFFLSRLYNVCTKATKPPKRCLVSFSPTRPTTFDTQTVALQAADGQPTPWYQQLTREFYLKL